MMSGWLYIIKNRDLYKIGITKNLENRMRQLKPDKLIVKLYLKNYRQLEKELHMRYRNVRIPQTEYFRLDSLQLKDLLKRIKPYNSNYFIFSIILEIASFVSLTFLCLFVFLSLINNDSNQVLLKSIYLLSRINIIYSLFSIFRKTNKSINTLYEIKYRLTRSLIYLILAFLFQLF